MRLDQITIVPIFPVWLIALLFCLGVAGVAVQYRLIRRKLGNLRAVGLSVLRLLALLLLISFALNPSITKKEELRVSPALAVILDTSQSMGLPGTGGKESRLEEAKAVLLGQQGGFLKSLSEQGEVKIYALGDSLVALEKGDLANVKAGGKKADLTEAVKGLRGKNALALLLSDGDVAWEDDGSKDLPVIAFPVGEPGGYRDLLIKAVKAPAIAFRGREVVVDVTVKGYGYPGLTLPVLLKEGSRLITARNVRLDGSASESTVSLPFTMEEIGQRHLSVSIPSQVGESLATNNGVDLSLKVIKDKIRILMTSGSPSMSYRFMRTALKNDPSVDLLSFVILRTPSDIINVPLQEQSLIPFPVETLFTKELKTFDLVIFDNLASHLYLNPNYYDSIRDFVQGGGGLAMIGGPHLLDGGKYVGTSMAEILPVRLTGKDDYRRNPPSGVTLSRAGKVHPITRFSSTETGLWREMPDLDGINLLTSKSSASVLLEGADGDAAPILTVGGYGKGRVLVLATDYSWKWYMGMVAKEKGNWAYLRLVERMIRWLTKDPSLDPIQITLPEKLGGIGEEIEVRIKAGDRDDSSNEKEGVSVSVFTPEGKKISPKLKMAGQPGEYLGSFVPEKAGTYTLRIETRTGSLEESILVTGSLENQDAVPDHNRLSKISESTGGKFLSRTDDLLKEMENYIRKANKPFIQEKRFSVWNSLWLLILIAACLSVEWYYRRRWGLV
jgi:uncharacterized membrane protein